MDDDVKMDNTYWNTTLSQFVSIYTINPIVF